MKIFFTVTVILFAMFWISCKKADVTFTTAELNGTWNIVSDSTYSSGIGPVGKPGSSKYIGIPGDYFTFTANKLYIREGNVKLDTATYSLAGDTLKLSYNYLNNGGIMIKGAQGSFVITTLDGQNLKLQNYGITPGGIIAEYIVLKR